MSIRQALLLIDLQNDFCPGGALAVSEGDQTIAVANRLAADFQRRGETVIATLDWHPAGHGSFASNAGTIVGTQGDLNGLPQIWWPDHCVQHSHGAQLHPLLDRAAISLLVHKGENAEIDSYSAFYDNGQRHQTLLHGWLSELGITALTVMGLATDYCVKFSVLDALALGYRVTVVTAGCRGVNLHPDDSDNALLSMTQAGAILI
ncbi:bifunctional nicotinamidase/pyrazinamidase [Erwinia pyrifoliae]|uniref:bifunctional nicotinamidase/pyrazinamidase n=1 Tax=Erwinia pyrifoliae TaxID=79967 RepID=UPI0001960B1E|nr:bifunctional nicotinamidase/pyrazinamidase [Erwinia pyrifoliae]AUX72872.1 nicotinamidase/pyrazinamidase [Erwinia pyrifoliae]MCA8876858.1 bifunctional nicotinamidase/pyrazinamidase [Erwinia pyrifoliae]MCT2387016.1 bifunctional nicotinamidase/pyrazinamidase [Erwinia pyrifoliae]MCU8587385.1 bifunctional nicotinamidase/pyrazinamidase [Erwinia pyrifoliae]CAX55414.1 Pyrazinamidase/nicotinamidase [Erwinia pyrifoliae Ep1/96]